MVLQPASLLGAGVSCSQRLEGEDSASKQGPRNTAMRLKPPISLHSGPSLLSLRTQGPNAPVLNLESHILGISVAPGKLE